MSDTSLLTAQQDIERLLSELRDKVHDYQAVAQDAVATLVRLQTARGLAAEFLARKRPYRDNPQIQALLSGGLLDHAAFIQKPPALLAFYRRLLFGGDHDPRRILEIGVKGGGSTSFWKALFPDATVIGMDLKLRRWIASEPSADGVTYLQGDQTDVARLKDIASAHGPFSLVIDDGSHVTAHQALTMRTLVPAVEVGGLYVVEDIHTGTRAAERGAEGDENLWPDFTAALCQSLRKGPAPPASAGSELAARIAGRVEEVILGPRVLALRVGTRGQHN